MALFRKYILLQKSIYPRDQIHSSGKFYSYNLNTRQILETKLEDEYKNKVVLK